MEDIIYKFLHSHHLFSKMNEAEIKELWTIAEFKRYKKGDAPYPSDRMIDRIYIVNQGRIKIAHRPEKNVEIISEIIKEGDIFGALSLRKSANDGCQFAQVMSPNASVFSFNLKSFESMLNKKPELAIAYTRMVGDKLNIISSKYCDLIYKDVKARVLNFFALHAHYEGKLSGGRIEINMYCTHKDIANFTASSRQTVSTIINDLIKEKKIIYEGRKKIIIPDMKRLGI